MFTNNKSKKTILPFSGLTGGAKFFLGLFAILALSYVSCKESNIIGLDVQPTNDLIGADFIDTNTIITRTVKVDSLRTDQNIITTAQVLLGSYVDPTFGRTDASIYTQLRIDGVNPSFGTSPTVDSVVLSFVYGTSYYGKTQCTPQKINVYRLNQALKSDTAYYSKSSVGHDLTDFANGYIFTAHPSDSTSVSGINQIPQLRIPLDTALGHEFLNLDPSNYAAASTFIQYFPGLYITTESSDLSASNQDGNIFSFLNGNEQSRLTVYYHNATATGLSYNYLLSGVARFNHFNHDYTNYTIDTDLGQQILNQSTPSNNTTVFAQGAVGLRIKLETPYIKNMLNAGRIAINQAKLVIKVNMDMSYNSDTFAIPTQLNLIGINDDGTDYALPLPDAPPYESARPGYYGGASDTSTYTYSFNIARYIEQVLNGTRNNNGLYLVVSNSQLNPNRMVVGGGLAGPLQMKLNIAYTKLDGQ